MEYLVAAFVLVCLWVATKVMFRVLSGCFRVFLVLFFFSIIGGCFANMLGA